MIVVVIVRLIYNVTWMVLDGINMRLEANRAR